MCDGSVVRAACVTAGTPNVVGITGEVGVGGHGTNDAKNITEPEAECGGATKEGPVMTREMAEHRSECEADEEMEMIDKKMIHFGKEYEEKAQ